MDSNLPFSLYYQLMEQLLHKIRSSIWPAEFRIPPERELCEQYQVSRITVRKALDELSRAGYIYRKQGKGTFVKPRAIDQKLSKYYSMVDGQQHLGQVETARLLQFDVVPADAVLAESLSILPDQMAFHMKCLRMMDGEPYGLEESYLPVMIAPDLTRQEVEDKGIYNSLRVRGIYPERSVERFKPIILDKQAATWLEEHPGEAAMQMTRITYDHGRIIEFCLGIIRGSRFMYSIEIE